MLHVACRLHQWEAWALTTMQLCSAKKLVVVYTGRIFFKLIICFVCLFSPYLQMTENLPELIERTMFHKLGRLINNNYKRKMRSLVFTLKHRDAIRKRVLSGEITVEKFVNSSPDQLLTQCLDINNFTFHRIFQFCCTLKIYHLLFNLIHYYCYCIII